MTSNKYNNYYGDLSLISNEFYIGQSCRYKKYIYPIILSIGKPISEISILEIGSGPGYFAKFCSQIWITQFTWLDLDPDVVADTWKMFPAYTFLCQNSSNFLKSHSWDRFDIVFLSHVFEHLESIEASDTITGINLHLSNEGAWVNIMPNAASLNSGFLRYHDYTHKILYTDNSMNQLIKNSLWDKFISVHSNIEPTYIKTYHRYLFPIILQFRKLFLLMMGWYYPIYTNEMLSVIRKRP